MEEVFKDVVGYEQFFSVSNLGAVWSKRTKRLLKLNTGKTGYKVFVTRFGGRGSQAVLLKVHRLVAEAFIPNDQSKPFVNHKDGCKINNSVINLEWTTASENTQHAYDTGLNSGHHGEDSTRAKLCNRILLEVSDLFKSKAFSLRKLGKIYGVSHSTLSTALRGLSYKNASF